MTRRRLIPGEGKGETVACAECWNQYQADSKNPSQRRYLFRALDALGGRLLPDREDFELQGESGNYHRRTGCASNEWHPATDRYVLCVGCGQEYDLRTGRD